MLPLFFSLEPVGRVLYKLGMTMQEKQARIPRMGKENLKFTNRALVGGKENVLSQVSLFPLSTNSALLLSIPPLFHRLH
jgi:hypothetical protein